jgi:glyoxylase-like metal-dependent hydrolase (beta-lactamase superfamily II)
MMLVQVADGVHRVTGGVTNFYLIGESGKYTVVDAGAPRDWALLESSLRDLGAGVESLDAVLITHAHIDHVGFAERARNDAGATVWVHQADAEAARTGKPSWKNEGSTFSYLTRGEFWKTALSLGRRGATKLIPVKEVSSFTDGEVIDVPGSPRAVHTPGHTPGSAAIFAESRSALLTGDALCTWNAYTGRVGPQIMPSALNMSNAQALESLDRLAGIAADVILPGHGDPWTGGIQDAITRARQAGVS